MSPVRVVVAALFGLWAIPAAAQPAPAPPTPCSCTADPKTYEDLWCNRVEEVFCAVHPPGAASAAAGNFRVDIENAVEVASRNWTAFLLYAQSRSDSPDLRPVEDARVDKQIGAPANGAGSSSPVSKGSVPSLLAFAVENGALTQSTSATVMTFRGNLVGWADLLKDQGFIASYQDDSRFVRGLRRVSYSFTLNTDTGAGASSTTAAASGAAAITPQAIREQLDKTRQQLAGYSVRVAIVDERDPRTARNRAAIGKFLDVSGVEVLKADNAFADVLNSPDYTRKWLPETVDLLSDPTLTKPEIKKILFERLEAMRLRMVQEIPDFDEKVADNLLTLQAFARARQAVFEAMHKRPLVAFEYVNTRTRDVPDASTFRLIVEGQFGGRVDLTGNLAFTRQNAGMVQLPTPTEVGGIRDIQAAAQLDVPLGTTAKRVAGGTGIGTPVFGVAYLSQKLSKRAAVTFQGNSFTVDPGWIHVVQARLTIPVKGSGVKMPLSISFANRTELLKEKDIRGHIGLTFDMDVLSSLVKR